MRLKGRRIQLAAGSLAKQFVEIEPAAVGVDVFAEPVRQRYEIAFGQSAIEIVGPARRQDYVLMSKDQDLVRCFGYPGVIGLPGRGKTPLGNDLARIIDDR